MPAPATAEGRDGWAALLADPGLSLVALDYDGTLSAIVDRPSEAVPVAGTAGVLRALSGVVGQVALVTGRPADVVVALGGFADVPGLVVLGQYGLQRWHAGGLEQGSPSPALERARAIVPPLLVAEPGAWLEDKGQSLVVHVRLAPDPAAALARLRPLIGVPGLEVHLGRQVLELRPPGFDKGRALRELGRDRAAVLFAGDDVGDLPAFAAVEELRAQGTPGLTVCSDSAEAPQDLRLRADLVVPGPPGVLALLQELLAAVTS